jgi:fatty acid desaturase
VILFNILHVMLCTTLMVMNVKASTQMRRDGAPRYAVALREVAAVVILGAIAVILLDLEGDTKYLPIWTAAGSSILATYLAPSGRWRPAREHPDSQESTR